MFTLFAAISMNLFTLQAAEKTNCLWDSKAGKIKFEGKLYAVEEPLLIQTLSSCTRYKFKNKDLLEIRYLSKPAGTSKVIQQEMVEFLSLGDNVSVFSKEIADVDPKTQKETERYFNVSFDPEKGLISLIEPNSPDRKSKDSLVQMNYQYDPKTNYFVRVKD